MPVLNSKVDRKNGVPIKKGSTLSVMILDGDFLPEVFGEEFEPSVIISVNGLEAQLNPNDYRKNDRLE